MVSKYGKKKLWYYFFLEPRINTLIYAYDWNEVIESTSENISD